MNDVYENSIDDKYPKYCHNQHVDIVSGFYRGNSGIITGYIIKDDKFYYNVDIISLSIVLLVLESDLRERKKKESYLKLIFRRK